jgi:hypothetical protein
MNIITQPAASGIRKANEPSLIRQFGSVFPDPASPGPTVGQIIIAPGDALNLRQRRAAEALPRLQSFVRGSFGPNDFDGRTLNWALRIADEISLWSPEGKPNDGFIDWLVSTRDMRRVAVVEAPTETHVEWLYTSFLRRRDASVKVRNFAMGAAQ